MLLLPQITYFYEETSESASRGALTSEKAQRYVNSWNTVFEYYLSHRPNSKGYKHNLEVDFLLYLQHTHLRAIMLFPYEKKDYNHILNFKVILIDTFNFFYGYNQTDVLYVLLFFLYSNNENEYI